MPSPTYVWLSAVHTLDFLAQCRDARVPAPTFQTAEGTTALCFFITPAQALGLQAALGTHSSPAMKTITRAFGPPAPATFTFHPLGHQDHASLGLTRGEWPRAAY